MVRKTIEIKNKYTNEILITVEGADLQGANLQGAYLQGADLRYASITIKQKEAIIESLKLTISED